MKNRILILLIALLAVSAATATAQQRPAPGATSEQAEEFVPAPGAGRGYPDPGEDENARKKIEAIRISRLTEALNLDEKTAARFIPAITALEQKRRTIMREHRQSLMELRRQMQGQQADPSRLKETIERYAASRRDMMKLREKEFDTAREHLTTDQLGRYLLFQQDFLQEVRELVSGMRGGGPGMRRPGRGPGRRPGMNPEDLQDRRQQP